MSNKLGSTESVISSQATYQLAAELAASLYSVDDILDKFQLTKRQLKGIIKTPHFRDIFSEAKAIWHGTGNVKDRIRTKAQLLLEDSVLPIYSIIHNGEINPTARIDAFAKLVAIADMQPTKGNEGSSSGEKFVLNITIGDNQKQVVIDGTTVPDNMVCHDAN